MFPFFLLTHLIQCPVSGISHDECSDIYLGPYPFSEVELRNLRDYVMSLDKTPILAVALHCYGNYVLYPYGYGFDSPANIEEIVRRAFLSTKQPI